MPNRSTTLFILQILIVALLSTIGCFKSGLPSENSLITQDVLSELIQEDTFILADKAPLSINAPSVKFFEEEPVVVYQLDEPYRQTTEGLYFQSIAQWIDCPEPDEYGEYHEHREDVEYVWKDYVVKISRRLCKLHDQVSLTIYRSGDIVYTIKRESYGDFKAFGIADGLDVSMGRDITGDGKPNLVLQEWSGGAPCCATVYIFEIGEDFRLIQTFERLYANNFPFIKVESETDLVYEGVDYNVYSVGLGDRYPGIILYRYTGESYEVDYELMRDSTSTEQNVEKWASTIRTLKNEAGIKRQISRRLVT
jgi:hypothetical protein